MPQQLKLSNVSSSQTTTAFMLLICCEVYRTVTEQLFTMNLAVCLNKARDISFQHQINISSLQHVVTLLYINITNSNFMTLLCITLILTLMTLK